MRKSQSPEMVAIVRNSRRFERHAQSYFSNGYASIEAFLAETAGAAQEFFEPGHSGSAARREVPATQKERRHGKRGLMRWLLLRAGHQPIDYFEFGVMSCRTFNRVVEWTPNRDARFYGFDTFEGLPEPWVKKSGRGLSLGRSAGDLSPESRPAVYDDRAVLFKGLFQDTLPDALLQAFPAGRQPGRTLLVNIDSDLYTSALYVLTSMHPLLRTGDYVYFDEFFDTLNEFAAFNDYVRAYNTKSWFTPVARSYDGMLFRLDLPASDKHSVEVIDRRTTHFLDRMRAYARARISLLSSSAAPNSD